MAPSAQDIDDALATPHLIIGPTAETTIAAVAVTMFPPPMFSARKLFALIAQRYRLEAVTNDVGSWRPLRDNPVAAISIARNGRTVITAAGEVVFDDSTGAIAPDGFDSAWQKAAAHHGRGLLLIGGPNHLTNTYALAGAATDKRLVGGWASVAITN